MLQKLKRLIGASDRSEKSAAISGELLKDQRLTNSINEIQFLEGHTDIVRLLLRIDQRRYENLSSECSKNILNIFNDSHNNIISSWFGF
jgi:hypothetical protein